MPKLSIYLATAIAIALTSCQQNSSNKPLTVNDPNNPITIKAISYLRSQLNLPANLEIVVESQKANLSNTSDLCQIEAPTQEGLEIVLVTDGLRHILQTNKDASKIEICRSEDAQPQSTNKYIGAGYMLRYPADWQAIDFGLEPSGASTVIFTPNRQINGKSEKSLTKLIKELQESQQVYTIVAKRPVGNQAIADESFSSEIIKDPVIIPFDAKVKGAKSGTKKEFTTAIGNSSSSTNLWLVQALTLETDQFIYLVRQYRPNIQKDDKAAKAAFDQFADGFALIP
ncbi:hypothetical protein HCU40_16140 [Pseudanabaena biceps]|nr:hypothetical protein [Pseudanabaena biceps]